VSGLTNDVFFLECVLFLVIGATTVTVHVVTVVVMLVVIALTVSDREVTDSGGGGGGGGGGDGGGGIGGSGSDGGTSDSKNAHGYENYQVLGALEDDEFFIQAWFAHARQQQRAAGEERFLHVVHQELGLKRAEKS
jgi:hypothetical protein